MENEGYSDFQKRESRNRVSTIWKYARIPIAAAILATGIYQAHKPRNFEGFVDSVNGAVREDGPVLVVRDTPRREIMSNLSGIQIADSEIPRYENRAGSKISGKYNYSILNGLQRRMISSQF